MRGLDRLVDIRRQGLRPDGFVLLHAVGTGARQVYEGSLHAEPADHPQLVDLRCLRGLQVIVVGRGLGGFDEAEAWARAAIAADAKSVALSFWTWIGAASIDIDGPVWLRWQGENIA